MVFFISLTSFHLRFLAAERLPFWQYFKIVDSAKSHWGAGGVGWRKTSETKISYNQSVRRCIVHNLATARARSRHAGRPCPPRFWSPPFFMAESCALLLASQDSSFLPGSSESWQLSLTRATLMDNSAPTSQGAEERRQPEIVFSCWRRCFISFLSRSFSQLHVWKARTESCHSLD